MRTRGGGGAVRTGPEVCTLDNSSRGHPPPIDHLLYLTYLTFNRALRRTASHFSCKPDKFAGA
jgi:hypothetical protein